MFVLSIATFTFYIYHYSKTVGVVDSGGVANLYGLWDWVGMVPRMGPESVRTHSLWAGLCLESW